MKIGASPLVVPAALVGTDGKAPIIQSTVDVSMAASYFMCSRRVLAPRCNCLKYLACEPATCLDAGRRHNHLIYNVMHAKKPVNIRCVFTAEEHRRQITTIDVLRYPMLGRHLPTFANRAFMLRWSNGTEVPLNSSFEKFVDVIISGLEEDLRAASG
jgi:hypothetical protein